VTAAGPPGETRPSPERTRRSPGEALALLEEAFPFDGYLEGVGREVYLDVAGTVARRLEPGARILDFGCGPLDKTALFSLMGYECVGVDDLQDAWHLEEGVVDTILRFADEMEIEFHRGSRDDAEGELEGPFDMVALLSVLEHLHESPRLLLNDLLRRLRDGGLLLVTVPNAVNLRKRLAVLAGRTNYPPFDEFFWYPSTWRGHVREYTRGDLESLVRFMELERVELRACHHKIDRLPGWARGLFRLITWLGPGWRDTWMLVARKPAGWTPPEAPGFL
jgi:SAM-dependent methyltransferase